MKQHFKKTINEHNRGHRRGWNALDRFGEHRHTKANAADEEFSAGRESMSKRYSFRRRPNIYHSAPIKRFLEKRIGCKWDKVYSELCEAFPTKHVVADCDVRAIVDMYVEISDVFYEDGVLYIRGRVDTTEVSKHVSMLYVDPKDGILKRTKQRHSNAKAEKRKTYFTIDGNKAIALIGEHWFMFDLVKCVDDQHIRFTYDRNSDNYDQYAEQYVTTSTRLLGVAGQDGATTFINHPKIGYYHTNKRSASTAEIKKYINA